MTPYDLIPQIPFCINQLPDALTTSNDFHTHLHFIMIIFAFKFKLFFTIIIYVRVSKKSLFLYIFRRNVFCCKCHLIFSFYTHFFLFFPVCPGSNTSSQLDVFFKIIKRYIKTVFF